MVHLTATFSVPTTTPGTFGGQTGEAHGPAALARVPLFTPGGCGLGDGVQDAGVSSKGKDGEEKLLKREEALGEGLPVDLHAGQPPSSPSPCAVPQALRR